MDATIVIERPTDGGDGWCWSVMVDGGPWAEGHEATKAEARRKADMNLREWQDMNA